MHFSNMQLTWNQLVLKEKTWAEVDDTLKKSVKALMAFHKYPVLNESAPLVKRVN